MRTRTVISDFPVQEGALLQYGSPIRARNPNPKLAPTLRPIVASKFKHGINSSRWPLDRVQW